jgi:hypothetical protein
MRRLLATVGLAALGLALTVPASAHNEQYVHEMAWTASPNPSTANDGAQVYSNDEVIAAKVFMNDGVKSWDVVMRPVNGGTPSTCHEDLALENDDYPQTVYINCPWDTTRAKNYTLPGLTPHSVAGKPTPTRPDEPRRTWQSQDLGPSVNGKYTIEITAYNGRNCGLLTCPQGEPEKHSLYQSGSDPARWREVWVVNGVAAPAGVSGGFDPATNRISVTWAPNPEPDIFYEVQEKLGDGKWNTKGTVPGTATRYERAIEEPGRYQYQVRAVRPAPTKDDGDAAKRSSYVAGEPMEIAAVTPPTTAGPNGADGAPDGGDPGVFIPGDTTTTSGPSGAQGAGGGRKAPPANRSGPTSSGIRPSAAGRPTGTTAEPGEAEGEGPDGGYSPVLPYDQPKDGFDDLEEGDEEAGPETLAGGVVPKPRDTRQLLIFMAISLTLFVVAMQITLLLRKSRPVPASANQTYQDDFDDWLGGF